MTNRVFPVSLDTAVFTTKYVAFENSPIVYVSHDEDGSWQFHGSQNNVDESEAAILLLEEIIAIDETVLELSDLPRGAEAQRKDDKSPWRIMLAS